jgi:glycosyltransferase involved in cell wall biosynthesis
MTSLAVTVVVPVLDEAEGIRATLESLTETLASLEVEHEIVVVDDGSTDESLPVLSSFPGIVLIENGRNLGYGASVKRGIRRARFEWVLMTDGDASYPADNIPLLLAAIEGADMVIGSRAFETIHNPKSWNLAKRVVQRGLERSLGTSIPDLNSGMRLIRRELALTLEPHLSDRFSYSSGMTIGALRLGRTVRFIPITYVKRRGTSKVRPVSFGRAFVRSVTRAMRVSR